jgi:hypothetical protein
VKVFYKALFVLLFMFPVFSHAQWLTIATAGQKVSIPVGMVIRYGNPNDNAWDTAKLYTNAKTYTVGGGEFPTNPDPGANPSLFVLQAWETPLPQLVVVNSSSVTVPVSTGTAIPTPTPGTYAWCQSGSAKTFNLSGTATIASGALTSFTVVCN